MAWYCPPMSGKNYIYWTLKSVIKCVLASSNSFDSGTFIYLHLVYFFFIILLFVLTKSDEKTNIDLLPFLNIIFFEWLARLE